MMSKMNVLKLLVFGFLSVSIAAYAHEGHDHGTPGVVQAPKGGVIRSLEEVHVELLTKGKKIFVYLYDHDLKPQSVVKFPMTASVALPRKKSEPLTLNAKETHWEAEFDAKGAHRFELILNITQGGHEDKVKFNVEPKK